jgi:FkbM family methyltransferase
MSTDDYKVTSYSQVAEDIIAEYLLGKRREVIYIDIGCLWPIKFSNTYRFYQTGGHGICIDPNPSVADDFRRVRPRDTFVSAGVGEGDQILTYHMFENPVFNTFDKDRVKVLEAQDRPGRRIVERKDVPVKTLGDILESADFFGIHGAPDLMSIDVEGLEAKVLGSIDFERVTPSVIIVETLITGSGGRGAPIVDMMRSKGYEMVAWIGHDSFFRRATR